MGDPETQSVLFRLETDLHKIMEAILDNKLKDIEINYKKEENGLIFKPFLYRFETFQQGRLMNCTHCQVLNFHLFRLLPVQLFYKEQK